MIGAGPRRSRQKKRMSHRMEIKRQQHALLKKNMAIKHIKIEQKRQRIRDLSKYYRNLAIEINMKKATGKLCYTILHLYTYTITSKKKRKMPITYYITYYTLHMCRLHIIH